MNDQYSGLVQPKDLNDKDAFPLWFAPTLAILFAILWSVWLLPHTVFLRHSCMVLGGILGLYACYVSRHLFFKKQAFPIYLVALLFLWVSLHLVFVGQSNVEQLNEYFGVWKKVFLCTPFALGMGFAIAQSRKIDLCWKIVYFGLTAPLIIYLCKLILTHNAVDWGIASPFLLIDSDHTQSRFGISRALYVFFCMPSFAIAIFALTKNFSLRTSFNFLYIGSVVFTPTLFYLEGDRTGLLMIGLLLSAACLVALCQLARCFNLRSLLVGIVFLVGVIMASIGFVKKFSHWQSVVATTKVALDVDTYDQWKYQDGKDYPKNELGEVVEGSNYERIAWWVVGGRLLLENPKGYGLLTLSFDRLTKQNWPSSRLSMTHSGWLDFALGYGVLGFLLLFSSSLVSWVAGFKLPAPWDGFVFWGFGSLNFIFLIKELSNEICVNALIFLIMFIGAFTSAYHSRFITPENK